MTIQKKRSGETLEMSISGRIDSMTAPQLEKELTENLPGVTELKLDFADVEYISSAGLRALLSIQQTPEETGGAMNVCGVPDIIREMLGSTGFDTIIPML